MHMHRYEKWWLTLGKGSLILFLIILGIIAFHQGHQPPSAQAYVNPEQVDKTTPFNEPGLKKVQGKAWDYKIVFVASAFLYTPGEILIGVNVLVSRTLFWYFGHPLVYFWLLPAYMTWYVILPKIIGGKIFSDSLARLSYIVPPILYPGWFSSPISGTGNRRVLEVFTGSSYLYGCHTILDDCIFSVRNL